MKRCSGCGVEQPLTAFWRDRSRRDGYQSHCKVCQNAFNNAWRAACPDKAREIQRRANKALHARRGDAFDLVRFMAAQMPDTLARVRAEMEAYDAH